MIILEYQKKNHRQIIRACTTALKQGKVVAYPTDTCYGLAVNAKNITAVKKLYKVKGRSFKKPVHLIPPSLLSAKKWVVWNKIAGKLAKKFWPGALTIVLKIRNQALKNKSFKLISAGTGALGFRIPDNEIASDLAKYLGEPITATSANVSGGRECYSAKEVWGQYQGKKNMPDIIISLKKKLLKRKHSTLIKVNQDSSTEILREGPISGKQILKATKV